MGSDRGGDGGHTIAAVKAEAARTARSRSVEPTRCGSSRARWFTGRTIHAPPARWLRLKFSRCGP